MPAPPSSLIDPAIGHLAELAAETAEEQPGLLAVLARVADPRHRRGVRHRLTGILGLALCAVVAGARSFTAVAEWAADADEHTLRMLGVRGAVPSESTFGGPCSVSTLMSSTGWPRLGAAADRTRSQGTAGYRGGRQDLTGLRWRRGTR